MKRITTERDHYALMDASEIVAVADANRKWMTHQEGVQAGNGAMRTNEFLRRAALGDESLVARSEEFMSGLEDQLPLTRGWRVVDDVVGAVPNVPSFLAGHPQHMRRRERVARDSAPLTIFVNLTSSMGIPQDVILRRGIVLLALVRMLVEHRAVELWVGTNLSDGRVSATAAWRIDTTPLDLARAAFHVSAVAMSRLFGYATAEMLVDQHLSGSDSQIEKKIGAAVGWGEVVCVPPVDLYDPMVTDPVGWLRRVMRQYVGGEEEG